MKIKKILTFFITLICVITCFSSTFAFTIGGDGDNAGPNLDRFDFSIGDSTNDNRTDNKEIGVQIWVTNEKGEKSHVVDQGQAASAWNNFYAKYRTLINLIYGLMILTCLAGMILSGLKLGASGDNPQMRQTALNGLLFCGGGTALLGIAGAYFVISMNLL